VGVIIVRSGSCRRITLRSDTCRRFSIKLFLAMIEFSGSCCDPTHVGDFRFIYFAAMIGIESRKRAFKIVLVCAYCSSNKAGGRRLNDERAATRAA